MRIIYLFRCLLEEELIHIRLYDSELTNQEASLIPEDTGSMNPELAAALTEIEDGERSQKYTVQDRYSTVPEVSWPRDTDQ